MANIKQIDDSCITVAKKDFKNETVVTFLGNTYSGKTVYYALLKNTIAKNLYDSTNGEYEGPFIVFRTIHYNYIYFGKN